MESSTISPGVTTAQRASRRPKLLRNELWLLVMLIVAFIAYRVRFFLSAGALWRDEVNSVDLSTSARISDIWHNLQYDSFPMLWHLVLRAWILSGPGSGDLGIRLLGLLAGMGMLAALFFNAWRFRTVPLVALALLGFSSAVICDGGSIRGYGLGMMLELFTFGAMWDVATRPNPLRVAIALLLSLAAIHMLFYNSVILAAVCCGAIAVAAYHRQWKRCGIIIGIGVVCAASMTIYLPAIRRADSFRPLLLKEPSFSWLWTKFAEAVSYDAAAPAISIFNVFVWVTAVLAAILLGFKAVNSKWDSSGDEFRKDVIIYHLTVLCCGLLGYTCFLWQLSYLMQPWYYLALMALLAVCSDGLIGAGGVRRRTVVCIAVLGFSITAAWPVWTDAGLRKTAIDTDAASLARMAKKGDLIIISPWYYGVTFQRYYDGHADYTTVPPVGFLAYHNYDLLIPWMQNTHAMDSTIARATDALKSGHAVFLFGGFEWPSPDHMYPKLSSPAPHNGFGWSDPYYYDLWQREIVFSLGHNATQTVAIFSDYDGVSHYERPWLFAFRGWAEKSSTLNNAR